VFEALKLAFMKEPVLLIPDNAKSFEVEADASKYATGAVLIQEDTKETDTQWLSPLIPSRQPNATIRSTIVSS
jgi:hypothetical protein